MEILASLCIPLFAALSRPGRLAVDLLALGALVAASFLVDPALDPMAFVSYLPAFYLGCMVRTHGRRLTAALSGAGLSSGAVFLIFYALLVIPLARIGFAGSQHKMLIIMPLAAFGLVSAMAWGGGRWTSAVLLHPVARTLGRLSYSFYLWHDLVLFVVSRLILTVLPPETMGHWGAFLMAAVFLVTAPVSIGIAALSYRWVEKPFIALGKRLAGSPVDPARTKARVCTATEGAALLPADSPCP